MIMYDLLFDPSQSMRYDRERKKTNKMMLNEKVHCTLYSDVYRVFRPKIQFLIKYNLSFFLLNYIIVGLTFLILIYMLFKLTTCVFRGANRFIC